MTWQEELYSKFVESEDVPYYSANLCGDPLELETFITSLLEKQREIIIKEFVSQYRNHVEKDWTINMGAIIDWIKDAPEPKP